MTKQREEVPNLEKPDGSMTESDIEKANVLSDFFKSVYVIEGDSPLPVFNPVVKNKFKDFELSVDQVKTALKALNPTKSQGPDGVHPRVLRELSEELAYPLHKLFQRSISEGKIPDRWREAEVRPIYKKGTKTTH